MRLQEAALAECARALYLVYYSGRVSSFAGSSPPKALLSVPEEIAALKARISAPERFVPAGFFFPVKTRSNDEGRKMQKRSNICGAGHVN